MNKLQFKGIKLAILASIISGFAVFINKIGLNFWDNAYQYTTIKNITAAIFLSSLVILFKKMPELKKLSKATWTKLILIGLIGGSIPFLLFFKALTIVSAPEAAFIHKTLFLWVALFSYPFLKERLSSVQLFALGILFAGVFMFGAPGEWSLGLGSILALVATLLWAIESIVAKIILKDVSILIVGWARMFIGATFLLVYLAMTNNIFTVTSLSLAQIGWTALVGLTLFGFVTSWYSALKHAPATIVSSVLVISVPVTVTLNAIFITHTFPTALVIPALLMLTGIILVSNKFEQYYPKFMQQRQKNYQSN